MTTPPGFMDLTHVQNIADKISESYKQIQKDLKEKNTAYDPAKFPTVDVYIGQVSWRLREMSLLDGHTISGVHIDNDGFERIVWISIEQINAIEIYTGKTENDFIEGSDALSTVSS